jgi:methyl-accepting chemotaxis protein PixJ
MTTHENLLNDTPEISISSKPSQNLASKLVNRDDSEKTPYVLKGEGTLRSRLLMTVLPTVLIPLAIASGLGVNIFQNEVRKIKLENIESNAVVASSLTNKLIQQGFNISNLLVANPLIVQELQSGIKQVESKELLKQPIEQTEKQFSSTKLLESNPDLNNYLKVMIEKNGLAEIILTERNGFNVAYSSPTSDFVQSDEKWWQIGQNKGATLLEPEFDESTQTAVLELVNSLKNPNTGDLLGVTKIGLSVAAINENLLVGLEMSDSQKLQIIDSSSGKALNTLTSEGTSELGEIIGGEAVAKAVKTFSEALNNSKQSPDNTVQALEGQNGISNVKFEVQELEATTQKPSQENNSQNLGDKFLSFEHGGRYFQLTNIPNSNLVVVSSIEQAEIALAGRNLMIVFALTAVVLGVLATGIIFVLAQKLSQPLANLTAKAQQVATGDLEVQAELEGTEEIRTLAYNFNTLVKRVNNLIQEQKAVTDEQRQQKEALEQGIYQLLEDLQDAVDGDLTVRASLSSMEMSTVADLFNAIIDSLNDIAVEVKQSSTEVSSSLGENEQSIQLLAQQAIQEVENTRKTLDSIEEMSLSIEGVATNANQAANLANDAYKETQEGTNAMDETVTSILNMRTTVGETAKKIKRLGESSQKISQVVSLIEEIALKTNLLAINASVEAGRAGEQGQGFTVVAEQVGALAEQSATATKEIAKIVAAIQSETQEVAQAMELGTSQVVDTTRLVESTKKRLGQVLERSRSINDLMKTISQSTVSQANTSRIVTELMQEIAQQSEARLTSSEKIAKSIKATAEVAKQMESTVEQFKVS